MIGTYACYSEARNDMSAIPSSPTGCYALSAFNLAWLLCLLSIAFVPNYSSLNLNVMQ